MTFDGEVAIVTRSASGIGEATAKKRVSFGASVVAADIDDEASVITGAAIPVDLT